MQNKKKYIKRNIKKIRGYVIKNKMNKSIVVSVQRFVKHNIYKKFIHRTTKLHVHDEKNKSCVGDFVEIQSCRPISKKKFWKLIDIIKSVKI